MLLRLKDLKSTNLPIYQLPNWLICRLRKYKRFDVFYRGRIYPLRNGFTVFLHATRSTLINQFLSFDLMLLEIFFLYSLALLFGALIFLESVELFLK